MKSSKQASKALEDIKDMTAFFQSVSFVMGKAMQHRPDTIFVQMATLTLLRIDAYLGHLKPGVKIITCIWSALCNPSLHIGSLFTDNIISKAKDEIPKHETTHTSQPRSGSRGFRNRTQTH